MIFPEVSLNLAKILTEIFEGIKIGGTYVHLCMRVSDWAAFFVCSLQDQ